MIDEEDWSKLPFELLICSLPMKEVFGRTVKHRAPLNEQQASEWANRLLRPIQEGSAGSVWGAMFDEWTTQSVHINPRILLNSIVLAWSMDRQGLLSAGHMIAANAATAQRRDTARKGAKVRHAENTDMRQMVQSYFRANRQQFKSKDAAATSIAGVIVPMSWRTVRDWLIGI